MATRCSTNPPLCLTARYTSIAFQRCSQLSFAVAMIIRSIHFRCCAMRIRAIPSPFQRKTALLVSVSDQRISLLFPRVVIPFPCRPTRHHSFAPPAYAAPCHCVPPRVHSVPHAAIPLPFCSSLFAPLPLLHVTNPPHRPCVSVRGDSLLCHSFAILC